MVAIKHTFSYLTDGSLNLNNWLDQISNYFLLKDTTLIKSAAQLALASSQGFTTFYGQPCIEQSLEMAEIMLDLKLDQESVATAIIASCAQHTRLSIDIIAEKLGAQIAQLTTSFLQMNVINNIANMNKSRDKTQVDRLRKLFVSMVSDIRVVIIKLAERICIMRGIKKLNSLERSHIAKDTMEIYAPLANRLGIGQLKWELEDYAFHYLQPEAYKEIASFLAERRVDREKHIDSIITTLKNTFSQTHLAAIFSGRAKHIYSIYLKMQKKNLDHQHIYDYSAIRITLTSISDCYSALSIVHGLWEHIPEEFDDYISNPKPNGYQSIHTAVIGPQQKTLEIQFRTQEMHEQAEHGIAAHWLYKENKGHQSGYESKITFLRQLLAWHKDIATENAESDKAHPAFLEDQVYVFTPHGEVIDLPILATPLDFAYHIHTSLGHRCRGAKINGHIVPLTYILQTGDQIEIISTKQESPSRDWLNKDLGYLTTQRARSKVAHWFKQLDMDDHIEAGRHTLERELLRAGFHDISIQKIATQLGFKTDDTFLAALGRGNTKMAHVLQLLSAEQKLASRPTIPTRLKKASPLTAGLQIAGTHDLLTRIARCCKPIPGDAIIGFITRGQGVSIHRPQCNNIRTLNDTNIARLIEVSWNTQQANDFYADLQVRAYGRENLLREIPSIFANLKLELMSLSSTINKKENMIYITMTVQINDLAQLSKLSTTILQLPNVISVKRLK